MIGAFVAALATCLTATRWQRTVGASRETTNGPDTHPVRTAETLSTGPVVEKLHGALHARYNRAADDADVHDTSFVQAGVTLRYPL